MWLTLGLLLSVLHTANGAGKCMECSRDSSKEYIKANLNKEAASEKWRITKKASFRLCPICKADLLKEKHKYAPNDEVEIYYDGFGWVEGQVKNRLTLSVEKKSYYNCNVYLKKKLTGRKTKYLVIKLIAGEDWSGKIKMNKKAYEKRNAAVDEKSPATVAGANSTHPPRSSPEKVDAGADSRSKFSFVKRPLGSSPETGDPTRKSSTVDLTGADGDWDMNINGLQRLRNKYTTLAAESAIDKKENDKLQEANTHLMETLTAIVNTFGNGGRIGMSRRQVARMKETATAEMDEAEKILAEAGRRRLTHRLEESERREIH